MLGRAKKPMKRTRIKKVRRKPRPGRLKGADMEALRLACFERDQYRCQAIHEFLDWNGSQYVIRSWKCLRPVTRENGHMAHKRNKRMWGDSLANVQTECGECHGEYHQYGPSRIKPVPAKAGREIGEAG